MRAAKETRERQGADKPVIASVVLTWLLRVPDNVLECLYGCPFCAYKPRCLFVYHGSVAAGIVQVRFVNVYLGFVCIGVHFMYLMAFAFLIFWFFYM